MKFQLKNNEKLFYQIITVAFLLVLVTILLNIFLFSDSTNYNTKQSFLLPNRVLYILSLAICITVYYLIGSSKKLRNVKSSTVHIWLYSATTLLLILQLVIVFNMYFLSGWDAGGIRSSVFEIITQKYNIWYDYSRLPNNINITAFIVVIFKFFDSLGINGYSGILIVNILLVNLAGVFTFLCTYNITHNLRYAIFSWFVFAFLIALSPWISIPYTDTFAMVFPIFAFYLYISKKPESKNLVTWFWVGFLCLVGYTIKPTVIIVLIAILLIEAWKVASNFARNKIYSFLFSIVMIAIAAIPVFWVSNYSRNLIGIRLDNNRKFTFVHFAMMGLNSDSDGAYSENDVLYSMSFDTVSERNAGNIEIIQDRLDDFGVIGYLKHLAKKNLVSFSDGSFDWSGEGNFYQEIPERSGELSLFLKDLYYRGGVYHLYLLTFQQVLWFVVLILLTTISLSVKELDGNKTVVMLTIIGITFFVMLFEARARYLYSYSPFFLVGASIGLSGIVQRIKKKS